MIRIADPGKLALRAGIGMLVVLWCMGVSLSQGRQQEKSEAAPVAEEWKHALQDEVDIAMARVQGKKAEVKLAKIRLGQVREVVATVEKNFKRKILPENSLAVGRLDIQTHELLLEMREAELKEREVRLAAAKRALERGSASGAMAPRPLDDSSLRLEWVERRLIELEDARATLKRVEYARPRG